MAKIENEYTNNPVCPYCGNEDQEAWDHEWGSHETIEPSCGACGLDYQLTKHESISYSTVPIVQESDDGK